MTLSTQQITRFERQIIIPEIGGVGQAALAQSHIAIIGLGGIGSPALQYLAGSGVGRLTLIDDGAVEHSNLPRQTIYTMRDIGHSKAVAARRWISNFDATLQVEISDRRFDHANGGELLASADAVLDGTDNFATRLMISDFCVARRIPLISAAVGRFQGQVGAFAGHREDQGCYRCFVGDAFDNDDCDSCADDGMLGAMAGWAGTLGAMQAVRVILEGKAQFGDPQWGKVHILDGLIPSLRTIRIIKDPHCSACGAR